MNRTNLIEIMIEELIQMRGAVNADEAEASLTNIVGYFEPLLRACAKEYGWLEVQDGIIS